jgi:hypothetical protein
VNYREPPQKKKEKEYGTWAWAQKLQSAGWRLEWTPQGYSVWKLLTTKLEGAGEKEGYRFRIDQDWYSPSSVYVRGSSSWATDIQVQGCRVRFNGEEYEVIP